MDADKNFKQKLDELFKDKFSPLAEQISKGGNGKTPEEQFIEGLAKLVEKREKEREADKRYREAHKEELKQKSKERYEANKEVMRIRNAEYKRKERERKKLFLATTE
jgi:hypothetical protein